MAKLNSIVRFLNGELGVGRIPDSSRNGLQVRVPKEIRKVGFAVDASLAVFEKAKRHGCDLVVVHHGIKWKGLRDRLGTREKRIAYLRRRRINLYACHLPLDAHMEFGNNAQLAKILGLEDVRKFGRYKGRAIGCSGRFARPRTLRWIAGRFRRKINSDCVSLGFGRPGIRTVGIVSGGGSDAISEAAAKGLDCFITGEAPHHIYHEARDAGLNVIVAGHYETETVGVKALMPLVRREFGVRTVFIDLPTPF